MDERYEWLRRSRTLLYDAYWPPFYPELAYDPEHGVALAKKLNADVIRFGTIGKWALYPSAVMPKHPALKGDLLGETIRHAHRAGIRVVAYIPVGHGLPLPVLNARPQWKYVLDDGAMPKPEYHFGGPPVGPVCTSGAYHDDILRIVREIVYGYDIDAAYLDGPYHGWIFTGTVCQCAACKKRYRADTGYVLPTNARYAGEGASYARDRARYDAWLADRLISITREIRAVVKGKSDMPLLFNGCAYEYLKNEKQLALINEADGFLIEGHRGGVKGVGRGIHYGKVMWQYTHAHSPWPRRSTPKLEEENRISGLIAVSQNVTPIVSYAGRLLVNDRNSAPVKSLFDFISGNKALFSGTTPGEYCCIISDVRDDGAKHDENIYGAIELITRAGLPASIRPRTAITEGALTAPVTVLPTLLSLTKEECASLARYVKKGGGLIVTGGCAQIKAGTHVRVLLGVKPLRSARIAALEELHQWSQTKHAVWDLYLKPKVPAVTDANGVIITCGMEPMSGGDVLASVVNGTGKEIMPGALMRTLGKGRIIYVPGSLETAAPDDEGSSSFFGSLVKNAARVAPPYRVLGAGRVFHAFTEKKGVRMIHLIDTDTASEQCSVRIAIAAGKRAKVRSLRGTIRYEKRGGREAVVTFSRHDCVIIEESKGA